MKRKASLMQLKKFDVTQRVVEMLADVESRAILFSIVKEPMTASDLSHTLKLPLSSVYKKLSELSEITLVDVERNSDPENGKRQKMYRSRIKEAEIVIKKLEPILSIRPNTRRR